MGTHDIICVGVWPDGWVNLVGVCDAKVEVLMCNEWVMMEISVVPCIACKVNLY